MYTTIMSHKQHSPHPRSGFLTGSNGSVWLRCVTLFLIAGLFGTGSLCGKEFRAGVVKIDITPDMPQMLRGYAPRMSTGVHDRIYHRIVALDDGITSFFLISSDLCSLSPAFCDQVTGDLARKLGVEPQNVWWSITHNHSSPYVGPPGVPGILHPGRFQFEVDENYTALVTKTLTDGVIEAKRKLMSAKLGVGWGYSQANINRRAKDRDGSIKLGMNPDGPTDRRIGLLRLEGAGGNPLALVANYAMHATVLGGKSTLVSGDAPGVVSEYVEQKIGAPMLYVNGAAGNIAPLYSGGETRHLSQFKVLLGDRILDANRNLRTTTNNVRLKTGMIRVDTPKRAGLKWTTELRDYLKIGASGEESLLVPIRFMKINDDILVWSAPMELFCEVSNEIRDRSPFPYTFYFGYTNGTFAYLPTEAEFAAGGYEPSTSPFTPAAASDLTEAVVNYIQDLWTRK
jgi:neutral ceramidase